MKGDERERIETIGSAIVHSAIRVHRALGPGLLESAYQACLALELRAAGLEVCTEVRQPIRYRGIKIDVGYRMDMVIEESVVVENKTVDAILPVHSAQLLTYLELSGLHLGFLLNWNVNLMKRGINRFVVGL